MVCSPAQPCKLRTCLRCHALALQDLWGLEQERPAEQYADCERGASVGDFIRSLMRRLRDAGGSLGVQVPGAREMSTLGAEPRLEGPGSGAAAQAGAANVDLAQEDDDEAVIFLEMRAGRTMSAVA